MLNYVWSFLLITGLIAGAFFGRLSVMVSSVFDTCKAVVFDIALPLAGTMMLWLGIMRVMEKAGLMSVVAKILSPILRRLFPEVPTQHPAMGAMTMNIAANMLGLGNSATPMGLKAMTHLQELNPHKRSASNAMCMFLALNTAGFTLIPMTAINYLNAGGVKNPQSIIMPTILATLAASTMAIIAVKLTQRLPMFQAKAEDVDMDKEEGEAVETEQKAYKMSPLRKVLLIVSTLLFVAGGVLQFAPVARENIMKSTGFTSLLEAASEKKAEAALHAQALKEEKSKSSTTQGQSPEEELGGWRKVVNQLSILAIPVILFVAIAWGLGRGVPVYEEMVEGAKEGFGVATRIMPFLVIMLTALSIFRESGALLIVEHMLSPILNFIGMPVELLPLAVMRPLSGSGAAGFLNEIILHPSSSDFLKYTAAVMFGSTETTFYVLAVYFGSVGIKRIRHALAAGLAADLVGMTTAIVLGRLLFGAMVS